MFYVLCFMFYVLCFMFCVLCFVFYVLCFVFCVLCFVFCVLCLCFVFYVCVLCFMFYVCVLCLCFMFCVFLDSFKYILFKKLKQNKNKMALSDSKMAHMVQQMRNQESQDINEYNQKIKNTLDNLVCESKDDYRKIVCGLMNFCARLFEKEQTGYFIERQHQEQIKIVKQKWKDLVKKTMFNDELSLNNLISIRQDEQNRPVQKLIQEKQTFKIDKWNQFCSSVFSVNTCFELSCFNISTKHCKRCKIAKYCSKECQTSDWKNSHKRVCFMSK